jgi:hypothetical protein
MRTRNRRSRQLENELNRSRRAAEAANSNLVASTEFDEVKLNGADDTQEMALSVILIRTLEERLNKVQFNF